MTVLGLDGCKGGWVAVVAGESGYVDAFVARDVAEAESLGIEHWGIDTLVIDIPIGLPDHDSRAADKQARAFIKPRGPSVFPTPLEVALRQPSYELACAASRASHARDKALSKQAFEIGEKILEVATHAGKSRAEIREGHPEVSFRAMAGEGLSTRKASAEGKVQRRSLLEGEGLLIPVGIEQGLKGAGLDDLLDAAAMAWTALRVAHGEAVSLPADPEIFSDGWPSAIWY